MKDLGEKFTFYAIILVINFSVPNLKVNISVNTKTRNNILKKIEQTKFLIITYNFMTRRIFTKVSLILIVALILGNMISLILLLYYRDILI